MRSFAAAIVSGCLLLGLGAAHAQDIPGGKDPPYLKRYEGSRIVSYFTLPYESYAIYDDPKDPNKNGWKSIEGQITRIVYQEPAGHSVLELLRNYEAAFGDSGFEKIYEWQGRNTDAALKVFHQTWETQNDYQWTQLAIDGGVQQMAYVTAKATKDNQDITLAIFIISYREPKDVAYQEKQKTHFDTGQVTVIVDAIASKAVQIKMIAVKASDMADALASKGSIDLYGIYFDTDKTDIKPESAKTLDEIANLLKIDRSLKLEIAGHTDNTGTKEHNAQLSEGRAKAVVDALVKNYNIDPARLTAKGYGDTVPIASNDTDDGKAKNRRVQLKKM